MLQRTTIFCSILVAATLVAGCTSTPAKPEPDKNAGRAKLAEAQEELKKGLTDAALGSFLQALDENPNLVEAHLGAGHIYRERGDLDKAETSYEHAATIAPQSFDANYYLGLVRQLKGEIEDAVRLYLQALTIEPDSVEANEHIAAAYLQIGKPADALPYARKAAELESGSRGAWSNLATTYSLMGKYPEAVNAYLNAITRGENSEHVLLGMGDAQVRSGKLDEGIKTLNKSISRKPTLAGYERLGYAYFKLHRFTDALDAYRKASAIDPQDVATLNGLGVTLMTLYIQNDRRDPAQREEALHSWKRSVQIKPDQPRMIDLIARYEHL